MSSKQNWVIFLGVVLIALNWHFTNHGFFWSVVSNKNRGQKKLSTSQAALGANVVFTLAVEAGGLWVASMIAGSSEELGTLMVWIMFGLLLLWAITHTGQVQALNAIIGRVNTGLNG